MSQTVSRGLFTGPGNCTRKTLAPVARIRVTTSRVWAGFSERLLITRIILGLHHLRREFTVMGTSGHFDIGSRRRLNGMPAHLTPRSKARVVPFHCGRVLANMEIGTEDPGPHRAH